MFATVLRIPALIRTILPDVNAVAASGHSSLTAQPLPFFPEFEMCPDRTNALQAAAGVL
jgi:hypothetical protein